MYLPREGEVDGGHGGCYPGRRQADGNAPGHAKRRAGEPTQPMGLEPVRLCGSPVVKSCLRPSWLTDLVSVVETVCPNIRARSFSV
jgi:hypothetical protein